MLRSLTVCLAAAWLCGAHAEAGPSAADRLRATALFQEGRALMAAGRIDAACPALEQSQRLDPSGGTLLNLALCRERAGELARALTAFNQAAAVAHGEGRADREAEATTRAQAIAARLPDAASPPARQRAARSWLAIGFVAVGCGVVFLALRPRSADRRRF